ncbi:hypothetical protein D3C72_2588940 [compost metagenome]
MGGMRPVHGDHIRQAIGLVHAAVIGGDADAAGRFDEIGGMADKGDLHLFLVRHAQPGFRLRSPDR